MADRLLTDEEIKEGLKRLLDQDYCDQCVTPRADCRECEASKVMAYFRSKMDVEDFEDIHSRHKPFFDKVIDGMPFFQWVANHAYQSKNLETVNPELDAKTLKVVGEWLFKELEPPGFTWGELLNYVNQLKQGRMPEDE